MSSLKKEISKPKRRTTEDIEEATFIATERLIREKGFSNVHFTEIMKESNVDPTVMYKRFDSILALYDKFIRRYDYWLHDLVDFDLKKESLPQTMKNILVGLIDSLYDNPIMQKILLWELSEKNHITERMSMLRELQSKIIIDFFNERIDNRVNFNHFAAILIGGIYFLILHKDVSTFCESDFNKEENKNLLKETVIHIIDAMYSTPKDSTPNKEFIITSLLKSGVDVKVIAKSLGLSVEEVKSI